jgi:Domain of unknown function (DUF4340)
MNEGALSRNKEKDARQIIIILAVILIAQIALSCLLKFSASQYKTFEPSAKLITADLSPVTKIEITQGVKELRDKPFIIRKDKNGWTIPSYYNAPVSPKRISKFFDMLKGVLKGLPVATTSSASQHFNVGNDDYAEMLTLFSEKGKVFALRLGNPSTLRTTYVRLDDSNDVFNAGITTQAVNPNPQSWFDTNMTNLDDKQVVALETDAFKLKEDKENWILTDKDGEHPVGKRAIADLLDKVTHVDCHSILSNTKLPNFDADNPVFTYNVTLRDGKRVYFSFSKATDKPWHVLKMSSKDLYFEVDPWAMKEIQAISAESVLKKQAEDKKPAEAK